MLLDVCKLCGCIFVFVLWFDVGLICGYSYLGYCFGLVCAGLGCCRLFDGCGVWAVCFDLLRGVFWLGCCG